MAVMLAIALWGCWLAAYVVDNAHHDL